MFENLRETFKDDVIYRQTRLEVDLNEILNLLAWKLLKRKGTHESLSTVWELTKKPILPIKKDEKKFLEEDE